MHRLGRTAGAVVAASLLALGLLPLLPSGLSHPSTIGSLQPNGGETLTGGSPYPITWVASHDGDASLFTVLRWNGLFITADYFPTGGATYAWPVPRWNSSAARVEVCAFSPEGDPACVESAGDFAIDATPPYMALLQPADRATNVPLGLTVIIGFSEPQDTAQALVELTPPIPFTATWANGDTLLYLNSNAPLQPCTVYSVRVVSGGQEGRWSFSTACGPRIESLSFDGSLTGAIVIEFSEPMNTSSVGWQIMPEVVLTPTWTNGNRTLILVPEPPGFAACTLYWFTIWGQNVYGQPLVPGPVPMPTGWTTPCPPPPPRGLRVDRIADRIRLSWNASPDTEWYQVYESPSRFAAWPWPLLGTTTATSFDALHVGDGQDHYYIVRGVTAGLEGGNSTMGVKVERTFVRDPATTGIAWVGLPYGSDRTRASDALVDFLPPSVDLVGKGDPSRSSTLIYFMYNGAWRGTDFPLAVGEGFYVGVADDCSWTVVGTDRSVALAFTKRGPGVGRETWISLPYTGVYGRASDVVIDIEGSLNTGLKIVEIGRWNATTQSVEVFRFQAGSWTGVDFSWSPGDGVYIVVENDFTWTPRLHVPEIP